MLQVIGRTDSDIVRENAAIDLGDDALGRGRARLGKVEVLGMGERRRRAPGGEGEDGGADGMAAAGHRG